eukprot:gnl/TRDRNA2_/TRDRNA2_62027_c0_seq1.p1 gnl/TRDRNA2_/TRDRNA2_62027_c0~~gnl/TRDRNA2_/TRDRNA2_62027_c0_seq1.p1  ORF type:complete len:422 (-),score=69.20 gnl/TRDRNA2_/TRDRNA2_62027_c0_seq1:47-1312(-)
MDVSPYLVSSSPNIWVFDGLLSDRVLKHVNNICDTSPVTEFHQQVLGNRTRLSRSWPFDIDEDTRELFKVIETISRVSCVEPFASLLVTDVRGDSQVEHMDHISLDHLARRYEKLDFIDMAKQSESKNSAGFIVPTFSMALYLNDVGGVHFPHAAGDQGVEIEGKPGRIIMWQNYIDSERPHHNQLAQHYGTYFQDLPKRLVTMGVLANDSPAMDRDAPTGDVPTGLIYCPGMLDKGVRHDGCHQAGHLHTGGSSDPAPPRPPSPPKPDYVLTLTATLEDDTWHIFGTNIGGNQVCELKIKSFEKFSAIKAAIEHKINTPKKYEVKLLSMDGTIMDHPPKTPIHDIFQVDDAKQLCRSQVLDATATGKLDTALDALRRPEACGRFNEPMLSKHVDLIAHDARQQARGVDCCGRFNRIPAQG